MFVVALKFATTLITTTYATKYTYIHATFLIWWHCVSEAERTIYQEFVMKEKDKKRENNIDRLVCRVDGETYQTRGWQALQIWNHEQTKARGNIT